MNRFGLILILIVAAVGAWAAWTFATTQRHGARYLLKIAGEDALNGMPLGQTAEALKLAMIECGRVGRLEANPWPGSSGAMKSSPSPSTAS
jgi:hypothetical protein